MQAVPCACRMTPVWRPSAPLRSLRELGHGLLDCLLPPHCCACGERLVERIGAGRLCRACRSNLEVLPLGGCLRCGEPAGVEANGQDRCGNDHRALAGLAFAVAPFRYRGTGGALVRSLKLKGDFAALHALSVAMVEVVSVRLLGTFRRPVLVSVPMHAARRRRRGFDQAELLAEAIGRSLSLEVAKGAMVRCRETIPQGDARVASRKQNVAGAFAVARSSTLCGKSVVLVDDVMTSGATARECAAQLREAGAHTVALLTGCRARHAAGVGTS